MIIGVIQGTDGPLLAPGAREVDEALGGGLAATLSALGATGAPEEVTKIASAGALTAPVIVAAGLGEISGDPLADAEALRRAAGCAVRSLAGRVARIAVSLPAADPVQAEAAALGALLGGYSFTRYRKGATPGPAELTLLADHDADPDGIDAACHRARVLAGAVSLVRDLVNTSPAQLYPETFAAEAERMAAAGGLDVEVLDEKALEDGGYGGIVGVGQGSAHPPRLVRLSYTSPGATSTIAFAGKGITFDSGGLSLKPAKNMEMMKSDMGGAAAVLGALQAIAALRPEVNVIGYLPLAENMPGGQAQRPSDVITMYGGTTVEVINTDAEGRLILADALARAAQDNPDLIVDVATLTGAQVVALGTQIAGVMASDPETREAVTDAARRGGEQAWPMPLPGELRSRLESTVADIANVAPDPSAGMLSAGVFLQEFVPNGVRWAHVDIAGPAFQDDDPYGYTARGGTGAGTRMLVQLAIDVAGGRL